MAISAAVRMRRTLLTVAGRPYGDFFRQPLTDYVIIRAINESLIKGYASNESVLHPTITETMIKGFVSDEAIIN